MAVDGNTDWLTNNVYKSDLDNSKILNDEQLNITLKFKLVWISLDNTKAFKISKNTEYLMKYIQLT